MTTPSETTPKKSSTANWIALCIGLLMLCAGTFSWLGDDEVTNNTLIEAGTAQACTSLIAEYPVTAPYMGKLAAALEAAVEARQAKPDQLANVVSATLSELTGQGINVDAFVKAIVSRINTAYKKSETEEQYLQKVQVIIEGIKNSVN